MTKEIALEEAASWFDRKISSILSKPRSMASKHLDTIMDRVHDVKNSATRFDYSDIKEPDVYQNYATTIFNKTTEIFDDIKTPEEITYKSLEDFHSSSTNQVESYLNVLAKYLTWLKRDRSYKDKVKNLDRTLSRLKEELHKFDNRTLASYIEVEKYEKVIDDIKILQEAVQRKKELETEIEAHSDDVKRISNVIEEKQNELNELKSHPGFQQLDDNEKELLQMEINISNKITEIKKLSNKVMKAADTRKIEIDDNTREIMRALVKDPLEELVKELDGYSGIKSTLNQLKEISSLPAIQMKKEKLERAFENIDEILDDGILDIQKRAKFLIKQSEAINQKFKEMEMELKIKKLSDEIDNLKIDRNRITLTQRRELDEINDTIKTLSKSITTRVEEYIDEEIKLVYS